MKVYIQTDIEGVAGVLSFEDRVSKSQENLLHRHRMYRLLTGEVSAAVRGAKAAGADVIYVNDSHGSGYNIFFEELEPGCEIIHGRASRHATWLPFLDKTFDALVCVGMHAMTCTPRANLPHSKWEVNGGQVYLSECTMAFALAGYHGVPSVFVSGDQAIVAEAREKVPDVRAAIVKEAMHPFAARSVLPGEAQRRIEAGVREGVAARRSIGPYKVPGPPYRLNILDSPDHASEQRCLEEDVTGDDFQEVFDRAIRCSPWSRKRGSQEVDGYRYPDNQAP